MALWGNKNWPPSMKVKKLMGCKWSSLNAPVRASWGDHGIGNLPRKTLFVILSPHLCLGAAKSNWDFTQCITQPLSLLKGIEVSTLVQAERAKRARLGYQKGRRIAAEWLARRTLKSQVPGSIPGSGKAHVEWKGYSITKQKPGSARR